LEADFRLDFCAKHWALKVGFPPNAVVQTSGSFVESGHRVGGEPSTIMGGE
jgi:hypothetical protein